MTRDIMQIAKDTAGPLTSTSTAGEWAEQFGEGWIDLWPWFGWNVPQFGRNSDAVGLGLAIQCAAVKARDIAKSEMFLWRRSGRNWKVIPPNGHRIAEMLADVPNEYHSWTEFWRMVLIHLEIAQNAYIIKYINRRGELEELIPVMPARVRSRVSAQGRIFYEIAATTEFERAQIGEDVLILPADRVIHLRGKMIDGHEGLSNYHLGNPVFELLSNINRYQAGLFGNDGKTPIVFSTKETWPNAEAGEAAFRRLKEQLREATRKMRTTGDPILLEAGLEPKSIANNSRDSMTAEAYNAQVLRICGIMEVPPHKIFQLESVKYDNAAAADSIYANDCLIPTARNVEERFALALLSRQERLELWPEFDRLPMMAGDPKTLMDVLDKAMKLGLLEVNEARERLPLGLNPIAGGDVRYVPVNMAVVDRSGNIVQQAAVGQNQGQGDGEDTPREDAESDGEARQPAERAYPRLVS